MGAELGSGVFLVANPTLRDPNFSRTVVLLCEHNEQGSMGLVINRPSDLRLAQALPDLPDSAQPLYVGGPVQRDIVLVLHREVGIPGARPVCDGMALGGDHADLVALLRRPDGALRARVFSGYAGWGAGQLQDEMRSTSWIVCPARAGLVFEPAAADLWSVVLRSLGPRYAHLASMPEDPRVN